MSEICCTFAPSFVYVYATYTNERTSKLVANKSAECLYSRWKKRDIYGLPDIIPPLPQKTPKLGVFFVGGMSHPRSGVLKKMN